MIMGSKVVAWFLSLVSLPPGFCHGAWLVCKYLQKSESITHLMRLDVWCAHRPDVSYQMAGVRQRVWICCLMFFCIWTYTINAKNSSPSNRRFHLQVSLPRKDRGHRLFAPLLGRLNTGLGDVHDQDEVPKNRGTWANMSMFSSHKASKPGSIENCTKKWWNCDLIQTNWFWDSYDLQLIAGKSPQIETSTWSQSRPRCWSIQASSSTYSTTCRGIYESCTRSNTAVWTDMI